MVVSLLALSACSPVRFVPEGRTLLTHVGLRSTDREVVVSDYRLHIRQEANSRWLSAVKVPLGIYCLSGTNERVPFNRLMHRIGEAPVVYNDTLMRYSQLSLRNALVSRGYLHAQVDTTVATRHRRTRLRYTLRPGPRSYVAELHHDIDNDTIAQLLRSDSASSLLHRGMPLDFSTLDAERTRIVALLQNWGYLNINNEFIDYTADTLSTSSDVRLTLHFRLPPRVDRQQAYQAYRIGKVSIHENAGEEAARDSSFYRNTTFYNSGRQHIRRLTYVNNNFVLADSLYSPRATSYSYQNLNALPAVNYATIRYSTPSLGDSTVDANVFVYLNKPQGVSLDLEGTNTAGDFGGAATWSYTHRNLLGGAQALSLKLRGAYEAIRRLEGYANQNYLEYGGEATLRFPTLPFLSTARLRRYKGATDVSLVYNSQNRPEFHRRLLTATWALKWSRHDRPNWRNHFDVLSLNYVFMPWISDTFRQEYLDGDDPRYAILRYSYENLFIMRSSYGFVYNSLAENAGSLYQKSGYQIRMTMETAGNLLYGISKLTAMRRNAQGSYAIGNIPYSQYVKLDADFTQSRRLTEKSSLAYHAAIGIAIPYGNSSIIPYEKRYFAGGANSVRGWSVRSLGPGSYVGKDGNIDFINQTGNLKLDLSVEYRTALFWKFEGAAFVDAGNVWNLRNYAGQSSGQFTLRSLYQQMAVAYGLGLRLNLNYFILRFDGGMKAINPAIPSGRGHYPILDPNFSRDFALHFAIGLPF